MDKNREKNIKSKKYWYLLIRNQLYNIIIDYMDMHNINGMEIDNVLNTKGLCINILEGNGVVTLENMIEICIKCGIVPQLHYITIEEILERERGNTDEYI